MKVAVVVATTGIIFNFGFSTMGRTCVTALKTHTHYFLKGYYQATSTETILEPHANEAMAFEDLFQHGFTCCAIRCFWNSVEIQSSTTPVDTECNCAD
jgi:hypothetical protein